MEGLTQDSVPASALSALRQIGPPAQEAVPAIVWLLKDGPGDLRIRAAAALATIDPVRARPAVPLLIDGLRHRDKHLREWAALALGDLGPAAVQALPLLRQATGDADPAVREATEWARRAIERPLGPESCSLDQLTPKAVFEGPDGLVAFFLDSQGRHLSAKAGQRFMDGVLTTVGWGGVMFRHETADASFEVRTREVTRPLFPSGLESKTLRPGPALGSGKPTSPQPSRAQPSGRRYEGSPLSLNLETDELADVLALFAEVSGLNIMLQPGLERRVSYKRERVPWDRALEEILKAEGLGWRLEGNFLRVARSQELRAAAPAGAPTRYTGSLLTFDCRKGRLADVLPILAEAGGLKLVAPAVDGELTVYCKSVPWDEILPAILRGRGLAFAVEGSTLRVWKGPNAAR